MYTLNETTYTDNEEFIPAVIEHLKEQGEEPVTEEGVDWLLSLEDGDPQLEHLVESAQAAYDVIKEARADFSDDDVVAPQDEDTSPAEPEAEQEADTDAEPVPAPEAGAAAAEADPVAEPSVEGTVVNDPPANPIVVAAQSNLSALTLGFFQFDDRGVHFVDAENKPSEGEAVSIIGQMYGMQKSAEHVGNEYLFRIGEMCDLCEQEYGQAFYSQAAEIAESDYQTIIIATMLGREYPPSFRKDCPNLTFTHYREVYYVKDLSVEEKQLILREADRLNMSCSTLRKFARGFAKLSDQTDKENLLEHAQGADEANAVLTHPTIEGDTATDDKPKFIHIHRGTVTAHPVCDAALLSQPGMVVRLAGPKLVVGLSASGKVQTEDVALG